MGRLPACHQRPGLCDIVDVATRQNKAQWAALGIRRQVLTPSQLARLLLQPAGGLTEAERDALEGVLHANPLLAQVYQLKTHFHTLLAKRHPVAFDQWLQEAESADLSPFHPMAHSFR
jgi:hypothetical protein